MSAQGESHKSEPTCPHLEERKRPTRHQGRTVAGTGSGLSQVLNKQELNKWVNGICLKSGQECGEQCLGSSQGQWAEQ